MAMWGDQTCQRFEATAVGFETGFSRLRVRPSNRYAIVPHIPLTCYADLLKDKIYVAALALLEKW